MTVEPPATGGERVSTAARESRAVEACPVCGQPGRVLAYGGLRDPMFGAPGVWRLQRCASCGLLYLDPQPTPSSIASAYTAAYAQRKAPARDAPRATGFRRLTRAAARGYLASAYGYDDGVPTYARVLAPTVYGWPRRRELLDYQVLGLAAHPGGRLLDVGCGVGDFVAQMARFGWDAEGLDTDDAVLAICRSRGLRVRQGTLQEQGYPDDTFDVVVGKHVIEHVFDPVPFLRECRRIVKPGGTVVMLTPNTDSWGHRLFGAAWIGLDPPRHLTVFGRRSLALAFARAGFSTIDLRSTSRVTGFNWRVSYENRYRGATGYVTRAFPESRAVELVGDRIVRLARIVFRGCGDEIVARATR